MAGENKIDIVCAGHLVIDDVIFHTGETCFGQLGGNSLYSALGAWFWRRDGVGVVSRRGNNLPPERLAAYEQSGLDMRGIVSEDSTKSPQSWQIYDEFGNRYSVFNPHAGSRDDMSPDIGCFPQDYRRARGVHLAPLTPIPLLHRILDGLEGASAVTCDPFVQWFVGENREEVAGLLRRVDVFLPSEAELVQFYGISPQREIKGYVPYLKDLAEMGAKVVVLKIGGRGVIVCEAALGECYRLQAPPVECVNVTGAGDAFCGGFVNRYVEGADAYQAAICGTVSASFVIERNLMSECLEVTREQVAARHQAFNLLLKKENL